MNDSRPIIDFDQHSQNYRDNWHRIAADFHATGNPIAWSPNHDGYWVTASWESVHQVASDWETFTSVNDLTGTENGGQGQLIPRMPYRLHLGESDPPLHTDRRRLEAPFFTPKALRDWAPVVQEHLNEALAKVAGAGRAELIDDVLIPTTARTTLHVLGYPDDGWQDAATAAHESAFRLPDDPRFPYDELARLRGGFRDMLIERGERPTGDIISALATGRVQGEPVGLEVGESMMNALVFGGFDTTVSCAASALIYLSQHPVEAQRLREDKEFRRNAIEELLRYFPPATGIARTAVRDTELLGQPIRAGERIYLWLAGANRDPQKFPDPDTLNLERENAREHVAFSAGHHRCLGSPLAKVELETMLPAILGLPDLRIDPEKIQIFPSFGVVRGYVAVPATFTPTALPAGA